MDSTSNTDFNNPITAEDVTEWTKRFNASPKNILAQNVCTRIDPFEASLSRDRLQTSSHVFEFKVENEGKPTTDQKNSGRCWIFAALNAIRIPFMKKYNLDDFEFSQTHLFYWDKIERCNYFLNTMIVLAIGGGSEAELDGRLMQYKLNDPINDGGQWTMLSNLVKKYGLMPKKAFPESFCSGKTIRLNAILKSKLREYTHVLRELAKTDREKINNQMQIYREEIHRIVSICLGIPPQTFTWEYLDKAKKYQSVGPVTALEFYERYVKEAGAFDVDQMVCLVSDPRPCHEYGKLYTIDHLGNVLGGEVLNYNNQPIETLMEVTVASIKAGQPVWFGCDVSKRYAMKPGFEDLLVHDFNIVFDVDIQLNLNKEQRLCYGESLMTHAMLFTGVSTDAKGQPTKFRVENSWGEDSGEKGYICMSADWFREFVYEVAIDRQFCSEEVLKPNKWESAPIKLPAWDPMGALAQ